MENKLIQIIILDLHNWCHHSYAMNELKIILLELPFGKMLQINDKKNKDKKTVK